jgi:hypothetical protein
MPKNFFTNRVQNCQIYAEKRKTIRVKYVRNYSLVEIIYPDILVQMEVAEKQ